uniref:Uncharacterized protein AlNc14C394G11304 n=1 Tax=Albugo laibachii Nc14 TaxID=890382 RepID=F0WYP1_9STRA|nr:conserved hypothetical protein [Albugo laibachii Nc14]|eukprot:CCA26600.1 conserved hypothetical protein [Albugo laibachii Nc14]
MTKRTDRSKEDENSDEERKESHVETEIFSGMQFYISRLVKNEQGREVGHLIQKNGGVVSSKSSSKVIELVDQSELKPEKNWVSTDFIYDSIKAKQLKPIDLYQYKIRIQESLQAKRLRVPYTIQDDARMLKFLTTQKQQWKSMESVPQNFWKLAERHKVTNHSAQSMHERFRKKLRGYTPSQVAQVIKQAFSDPDPSSDLEEEYVNVTPIKRDKRSNPPEAPNREDKAAEHSSGSDSDILQSRAPRKRPDRKRSKGTLENESKNENSPTRPSEKTQSGTSYPPVWKKLGQLSSEEQEKMFEQPEWRRLLQAAHHVLLENESKKLKIEEKSAPEAKSATRMIDRSKKLFVKSRELVRVEADSESVGNLIRQIQFESKQTINAVIHALFYANGDIAMARDFLKGGGHKGMWTSEEDKLLLRKYREATPEMIAIARENGDLATISKSAQAISLRIEYLLKP